MSSAPTILLVHGACYDSTCWSEVIPRLEAGGFELHTVDLVSTRTGAADMHADAAAIRAAAAALPRCIVVCHSYGGVPTTQGLGGPVSNVAHIVYLTAFVPDRGQSLIALSNGDDEDDDDWAATPDGKSMVAVDPLVTFFNTTPPDVAKAYVRRLRPQPLVTFEDVVDTTPAWASVPSSYVVTTQDSAIPASVQRSMATRTTAVHELSSDHSPFLSIPEQTAALLARIAHSA